MAGSRIARRDPSVRSVATTPERAARPDSGRAGSKRAGSKRAERPANALDRYSLGLQLVQVFPVLSGVALAFVTIAWLARVLAAVTLVSGAVWVVWRDRSRRTDEQYRDGRQRRPEPRTVLAQPDEYHVSTRVGPTHAAFRHRYRRRRLREIRSRPSPPSPPRAEPPRGGRLHYGSAGPGIIARRNPAPNRSDFPGY